MKIRQVLDKKVHGTSYYQYEISLPKELVENSNLLDKKLIAKLVRGQIVIGTGF